MAALATSPVTVDSRHAGRGGGLASAVPGRQLRLRHQLAPVRRNRLVANRALCPDRRRIRPGRSSYTVAIVGVDGWAVGKYNTCLQAEVRWAAKAQGTGGAPYDLYMFLNSPSSSDTIDQQGPAGTCSELAAANQAGCLAYNYGYNAAQDAVAYASLSGRLLARCGGSTSRTTSAASTGRATSPSTRRRSRARSTSCTPRSSPPGSTRPQSSIRESPAATCRQARRSPSGSQAPTGPRRRIRRASATHSPSVLARTAARSMPLRAAHTWLLQETPGPNNYPFDPDYAC